VVVEVKHQGALSQLVQEQQVLQREGGRHIIIFNWDKWEAKHGGDSVMARKDLDDG
jgi:hypothetical protein